MHELSQGEIFVKGKKIKVHSPKDIIKEGVALITEDRKVTGLNLSGSVNDNIAMVAIKKLLSHGLYNKGKARAASMEYIKKLNIKTPSGDQIAGNLSGGNQQKIVIAKWLLNDPDASFSMSRPAVSTSAQARYLSAARQAGAAGQGGYHDFVRDPRTDGRLRPHHGNVRRQSLRRGEAQRVLAGTHHDAGIRA